MDHLPPVGWVDVARRSDIQHLSERVSDRFDAKLESKLNSQTKTLVGLMTALVVAVAGLAFAAARLA
jgi:hypothetical protein